MNINIIKKHWFWKYAVGRNRIFNENKALNSNILICSKVFYALLFIIVIDNIFNLEQFIDSPMTEPEWSIFWTRFFPNYPWQIFFTVLCFISNSLTLIYTTNRNYRIINFFLFFFLFSSLNSYPKISHNLHTALIPLFFLCFISFKESRQTHNALIYATAIGSLLITYSLSGLWKTLAALKHLVKGDAGSFDLDGMTRYINYQFVYSKPNQIAQWLIEHEVIGFSLLWVGIILELVSIGILFIPKLHKWWGIALLLMHIGIANILEVKFMYLCISIVPLLLMSPFGNNFLSYTNEN